MYKYYITEEAFEKIFLYLKDRNDIYCKKREKTRIFLESVSFILTPGQWSEVKQASELIKDIKGANILADKAFDSDEFIDQIVSQNCIAIIPPRSNRKVKREVDYHLYKERHLAECFFGKVKHFRRIFSRFDKMAQAYMGFLAFASTILWLK